MEQFVWSNYTVFISKHIQEPSAETPEYKDGFFMDWCLISPMVAFSSSYDRDRWDRTPGELPGEYLARSLQGWHPCNERAVRSVENWRQATRRSYTSTMEERKMCHVGRHSDWHDATVLPP